jgi:inosine-uridine nucleoside N-ribohydrolase
MESPRHARLPLPLPLEEGGAPPVVVDIDADFDDISALAYLCQAHKRGEIRLLAVTVTNSGAGYPGKAIQHTRCALQVCGLPEVAVADATPWTPNVFSRSIRDDADQVLDDTFRGCKASPASSAKSAPETLVETLLAQEREEVRVMTFGPLSNLAAALAMNPDIVGAIASVHVMGGAVSVRGNLCCGVQEGFDNSQEFNLWIDPAAAGAAFGAFEPEVVHLVPLDATRDVPISREFGRRIAAAKPTAEASVVAAITNHAITAKGVEEGTLFWWDPLNAVASVHPEVVTYETKPIGVVQEGPSAGRTQVEAGATRIRVAVSANRSKFEALFLDALIGQRRD